MYVAASTLFWPLVRRLFPPRSRTLTAADKMVALVMLMWLIALLIVVFLAALFLTRTFLLLRNVKKNRDINIFNTRKRKSPVKTLIIAGSGGHTAEMLRLVQQLRNQYRPRHYVVACTDNHSEEKIRKLEEDNGVEFQLHYVPRSREVAESWLSTVVSTLRATCFSFPLVFSLKPDLVLANGPGTCIPLCIAAFFMKVLGVKRATIVYVESICRVETLSLSGKILYHLADQMLVQWPQLQEKYPLTRYMGRLV